MSERLLIKRSHRSKIRGGGRSREWSVGARNQRSKIREVKGMEDGRSKITSYSASST